MGGCYLPRLPDAREVGDWWDGLFGFGRLEELWMGERIYRFFVLLFVGSYLTLRDIVQLIVEIVFEERRHVDRALLKL